MLVNRVLTYSVPVGSSSHDRPPAPANENKRRPPGGGRALLVSVRVSAASPEGLPVPPPKIDPDSVPEGATRSRAAVLRVRSLRTKLLINTHDSHTTQVVYIPLLINSGARFDYLWGRIPVK